MYGRAITFYPSATHVIPRFESDIIDDVMFDYRIIEPITEAIIQMKAIGTIMNHITAKYLPIPRTIKAIAGARVSNIIDGVIKIIRVTLATRESHTGNVVNRQVLKG